MKCNVITVLSVALAAGCLTIGTAEAACKGSNGRGWASGKGNGKYQMTAADKSCSINFPGFIFKNKPRVPAKQVSITRPPKSGTVKVTGSGVVYTPSPGFKGSDKFCTKNTSPKVKGQALSGCVTVAVK